jgi:hypothetical protein
MDKQNSHFFRPSSTVPEASLSGDGQSALIVKSGVSPSRSHLLTGSHRYHPGTVQQAQGRSAETAVSPHHKNQSTSTNFESELGHSIIKILYGTVFSNIKHIRTTQVTVLIF